VNPLARHALLERRAFLRGALATAGALAVAGCTNPVPGARGPTGSSADPTTIPPEHLDASVPYWLQGGFAPVTKEVTAFDLPVTGSLPPSLTGLYVRNGSNPPSGKSSHWFLGDGMVHGIRLDGGKASWYRNRWVQTPLLTSPGDILSGASSGLVPGKDVTPANTSMAVLGGRLLALCEVGFPFELATDDLRTVGPFDFDGALTTAVTAHPKIDPATGRAHFFGYGFVAPFLTYHVAEADGTLVHSEEVAVPGPTMIHDFAITDRDVIFWDLPVVFDLPLALKGEMPFRWDPSYGARVGVMPLGGPASAIRWVTIDPCYVFHGTNAFRDGDDIVLDVSRLPSMFDQGASQAATNASVLHRWTIDTSAKALTLRDEQLNDLPIDLPTIDKRLAGRRHRFGWFAATRPTEVAFEFAGVVRWDFETSTAATWDPGPAVAAGEGLFVPDGSGEDEGWILTFTYDRVRDASDLVVLDASDVARGPVATVALPQRVPFGFHATWMPA
jgi:carotenoid cleavage dioxygenase